MRQATRAIEKNANYKKEASQRQREKAARAAAKAAPATPATPVAPVAPATPATPATPVASEEATNASEAKIFAVLDAMGIGHVATGEAWERRRRCTTRLRRRWRT